MRLEYVNLKNFTPSPFDNLHFFAKHFCPYVLIKNLCVEKIILEIGFGDGYGLHYLSPFVKKCVGIDIKLNNCIKAIKKYNLKNLLAMDGINLGFKEKSFDIVYCFQVIEHISEEEIIKFLKEIKRILKKEGIFICSTLNLKKNIKGKPEKYVKFHEHKKEYTFYELERLLKEVFENVKIYGLFPTLKHRFFLRLKKWGFLKYNLFNRNPVKKFYDNISTSDFKILNKNLRKSIDFIALCSDVVF